MPPPHEDAAPVSAFRALLPEFPPQPKAATLRVYALDYRVTALQAKDAMPCLDAIITHDGIGFCRYHATQTGHHDMHNHAKPSTLADLCSAGWRSKTVKEEIHANF